MNETEILEILKGLGYSAAKIEESDERSADYLIQLGDAKMVGELKTKGDSAEFLLSEERALSSGQVHLHFDSTARNNRISGIVGDAIPQIKNVMERNNADFGLAIFEMLEPYAGNKVQKLINTLYGRKFAVPLNTTEKIAKWCYYCTYSDFFRYKQVLNAAFIFFGKKLKVCVNNLAENYTKFLRSGLLDCFKNKFIDPAKEIETGEAMEVKGEVDRTDDGAIQEYFRRFYGFEAVALIDFPSITASTRIH
jgi:hypothetical protein